MADLAAGLTVGLVLVPQAMAYAALAGMPPETGLYAACFACIIGAAFGQCAQINTGPVAMTSLLSFAALAPLAEPGSSEYITLAAVLAILVGVSRVIIGLIKGTFLVALISQPVLTGFTAAAGITIASTQVPKIFNLPQQHDNPIFNVILMISKIGEAHLPSLIMGIGTLIAMILLKKFLPKWPGLLMALVGATLISHQLNFQEMGGQIVGTLPAGIPPLRWPNQGWDLVPQLLPAALLVSIIGLLEVMTVTSTTERVTKKSTNLNAELIGQGLASFCAGVTGGFPVSGSLSRSSLNLLAGAITGMSSVISGIVVLLTLLWLTPLLEPLPYPALAAAIVMAVSALIRPQAILAAWSIRKSDAIFGFATLFITLYAAPEMVVGMSCGIGLNLAWYLYNMMNPSCIIHSPEINKQGSQAKKASTHHVSNEHASNFITLEIQSRLCFLNATKLAVSIKEQLSSQSHAKHCFIICSSVNDIDSTGVSILVDLLQFVNDMKKELILIQVKPSLQEVIRQHEPLNQIRTASNTDEAIGLLQVP